MSLNNACLNCGSDKAGSYKKAFITIDGTEQLRIVHCGDCKTVKPSYPTDAAGNKVEFPKDQGAFYSYAGDTVFTSARQMAEHLKKHDLIQKGNDVNNKDKRLRR